MDDGATYRNEAGAGGTGSAIERRLVMRILRYWRDKAEPNDMPAMTDLNTLSFEEFAPYCWTAQVGQDEKHLAFETIGDAYGLDDAQSLIGAALASAPSDSLIGHATSYAAKVVVYGIPMSFGGKFQHLDGRMLLFRSIILPLRGADGGIGHLLGAANYRCVQE